MKRWHLITTALLLSSCIAFGQDTAPLKLVRTIALPGVEGRMDHLTVDVKRQQLFIAALANNTLEVVDLAQGKRVRSITGLNEPQGIVFAPELNRVFVADGGDGMVRAYDAGSLNAVSSLKLGADADNIRYDSARGQLWVGYGSGALAQIDAKAVRSLESVKLSGHPESFQLETSGQRIYVNVPDANHIAVVDATKHSVITTWAMGSLHSNFPMALDERNHRLFVATRSPARLVVLDTGSGKQIAALNCSGDADDIFYDQQSKRIYIAAGEGFIDVFQQQDGDHYQSLTKVQTAPGARTALFVPELQRIFLAVPHRGNQQAAVRVYDVSN